MSNILVPGPRASRWNAARLVVLLGLLLVGGTGCDSILGSDDNNNDDSIEGTWRFNGDGFTVFLQITSSSVTVYDGVVGECFVIDQFTYTSNGNDQYTVTDAGSGFSFTLTIRREGADLRVIDSDDSNTEGDLFSPSNQDLTQLEECTETSDGWGGTDPSIDCSTLPQITIGMPVDGELASGDETFTFDPANPSVFWYYDLYGLTLPAAQSVAIGVTSEAFDTYLYLYEADGTYLDENDDADVNTLNSALGANLQAGCYRVEVTSFWPVSEEDGTGAYTLTVD